MTEEVLDTAPAVETETVAPETTEQAEPATEEVANGEEAAPEGDDSPEEKPKKEHWATKRINELTREKYEERARAEAMQKKLAEYEKPQVPTEKPNISNYQTIDEYEAALLAWGKEQGKQETVAETQKRQAMEAQAKAEARIRAQAEQARSKHSDFDTVVAPFANVIDSTPVLAEYAMESEIGGEMLYHLSKNPTVLFELSQASPLAAMRQLITLEQKLKTPVPKQQTKAPEPIKPVGTSEKAAFDPETADMEAYAKWRREQSKKGTK